MSTDAPLPARPARSARGTGLLLLVGGLIGTCLYVIGALCPWCMAVWAVMIPLFWYVTRHLAQPGSMLRAVPHGLVPPALYAVLAALIAAEFGGRLL
ncbi:vitamin K epoxide reductase family protein [Streptomyces sp. NPDC058613]|uniref:vitamin K epoxide reductase family protein n=1 Tax=unclassified Streptomyces TaxID=2593676 RepID=UPI003669E247